MCLKELQEKGGIKILNTTGLTGGIRIKDLQREKKWFRPLNH
jgi:hypothetical protein